MPLLVTEAAKLRYNDLQKGVIEEVLFTDEMFALLPFVSTSDATYSYIREGAAPAVGFFGPYDSLEESAASFTEVSTKLKALGGQIDIDNFTALTQSSLNSQVALQLVAKAKAIAMFYRDNLINGDTAVNAKGFDGLKKNVAANMTMVAGVNGAAVSYSMLDELLDMVKLGADALMMRRGTLRAIRALNRAQGGNNGDMIQLKNFGRPVPSIEGIPVIINDFIKADEAQGTSTNTCSIYAIRMNETDGVHGLYHESGSLGWTFDNPGLHFDKDLTRYRLKWYTGLAQKATHSVARLKGVTNV